MDELEFCANCQEIHKKNQCSGEIYQDKCKDLIKLPQNPFQEFPKQHDKFSIVLALLYYIFSYALKPIRGSIMRQVRCVNLECQSPLCLISGFFCSINEPKDKKALKDSMLKLSKYIDNLVNSGVLIETALDAFQALTISNRFASPCKKLDLKQFFKLKIIETYKCACGQELNCKGSGNFINIDIDNKEEAITYSFFSYLKQKLGKTTYSICKSSNCMIKYAKKSMSLKVNPVYFSVKINWKIEPSIELKSVSLNFSSSDLFKVDTSEVYSLIYIAVVHGELISGFYNISGIWHDMITKSNFSFSELLAYIQESHLKIELLIYQREMNPKKPEVRETILPATLLQSPKKPEVTSSPQNLINFSEKVNLKPAIDQTSQNLIKKSLNSEQLIQDLAKSQIEIWTCPSCQKENNYNNLVCSGCFEIQPGKTGWVCKKCNLLNDEHENLCLLCEVTMKTSNSSFNPTDFTKKLCEVCNSQLRNGLNCQICQKSSSVRRSEKMVIRSEHRANEVKSFCPHCGGLSNNCKCRYSAAKKKPAYENRSYSTQTNFYYNTSASSNCNFCKESAIELNCITCRVPTTRGKCSLCQENSGSCEKCIKSYCKNCHLFNDCSCSKVNHPSQGKMCQSCKKKPSNGVHIRCIKCNRQMGLGDLCEFCMKKKEMCDKCKKNR